MAKISEVVSTLQFNNKKKIKNPTIKQIKQAIFSSAEESKIVCPEPYNMTAIPNSYYLEQLRYSQRRFL